MSVRVCAYIDCHGFLLYQISVGDLFVSLHAGHGAITQMTVTLQPSQSFTDTPPNFTLYGKTEGGPPVEYTWTRNGAVITSNGSYNISIRLKRSENGYLNALYISTLIVTGVLPGVYQYSVNNKATPTSRDIDINIEGNYSSIAVSLHLYNNVPVCLSV